MNRRSFPLFVIWIVFLVSASCNLPRLQVTEPTPTSTDVTATASSSPALPTAELGTAENPLILALPPSANLKAEVDAANAIAAQFTERTGYVVVTVIPDSSAALVEAFSRGNAHIALLEPFAYELAYRQESVKAAFAQVNEDQSLYGAQFLAPRKAGFTSYFNPLNETNTLTDAGIALAQFNGRKPCWSDERSPSGYVIPLGYLKANNVTSSPAAFVQGHPTVVRSLYASGICDFGATYIDARKFPSLEDQFPDLMERVVVIWRIPEIIPYNVFVFSSAMPQPMRDLFASTLPVIMQTDQGREAFNAGFGIQALRGVNDAFYHDFRTFVAASQIDLLTLLK